MAQQNVNKCPACGALRESFAAICPECGYEFTDVQTSNALANFTEKIEQYDRQIAMSSHNTGSGFSFWIVVAWIFLFPIMFGIFIIKKINAKHTQLTGIEKAKAETILNFPIPNSRNDLLEFSIFAENHITTLNFLSALLESGINTQKWNKIWLDKAKQIEGKASIVLKEDKSTLSQIKKAVATIENIYKNNDKTQWIATGALGVVFVVIIIFASI